MRVRAHTASRGEETAHTERPLPLWGWSRAPPPHLMRGQDWGEAGRAIGV